VADLAERFAAYIVVVLLAAMVLLATPKAKYKPFWLDEILGVLVAKLPHASEIWAICKIGADGQPPLYNYLLRASIHLFGNDALGLRMPSVVAYSIFSLSLYRFVSRRTSRLYGLIAFLFPSVTGCWYYATEGRAYALVLACTGIAAVCWQSIAMGGERTFLPIGLGLSLALAVNFHYYSVLLLVPFAAAEWVRSYERRRIDFPVCFALLCCPIALLPDLPILRDARPHMGIFDHSFRPAWFHSVFVFAEQFLGPAAVVALGLLFVVVLFDVLPHVPQIHDGDNRYCAKELIPDVTLVLALACIPIITVVFSKIFTQVLFARYMIAAVFGITASLSFALWFTFRGRRGPALAAACLVVFWCIHVAVMDVQAISYDRSDPIQKRVVRLLPQVALADTLPIAVAQIGTFMTLYYYGDPIIAKRLVYVASEELSRQLQGFNFLERIMVDSAPYFGTPVVDYHRFVANHSEFYVVGGLEMEEWLTAELIRQHANIQLVQGGAADAIGDRAENCFRVRMRPGRK
jgi:hypothetical protein